MQPRTAHVIRSPRNTHGVAAQIAAHRARLVELRASRIARHRQLSLSLDPTAFLESIRAARNVVSLAAHRMARFPVVGVSR